MNGVILVDKPKGWTSQDVINKVKRLLNAKKVGHAGTLDPLATGLLIVLVNNATKLSDYLLLANKEYECRIEIGKKTDTGDATGEVIETKEVDVIQDIDAVLKSFCGKSMQTPPMYSSIHHHGVKLYELARRQIKVEIEAREIEIYEIARTSSVEYFDNCAYFSFRVRVSKGTYIRSLCEEIGNRLKFPANMKELRRISSGEFKIDNASTIEDIAQGRYEIIPMLECLNFERVIEVDETLYKKVINGNQLSLDEKAKMIAFTREGELIGLYEKDNDLYKAKKIWN